MGLGPKARSRCCHTGKKVISRLAKTLKHSNASRCAPALNRSCTEYSIKLNPYHFAILLKIMIISCIGVFFCGRLIFKQKHKKGKSMKSLLLSTALIGASFSALAAQKSHPVEERDSKEKGWGGL